MVYVHLGFHLGFHSGFHLGFHSGFHSGFYLGIHSGIHLGIHSGFHLGIHLAVAGWVVFGIGLGGVWLGGFGRVIGILMTVASAWFGPPALTRGTIADLVVMAVVWWPVPI